MIEIDGMESRQVPIGTTETVLRWIAVLPCALLGGLAASALVTLINKTMFSWQGFDSGGFLSRVFVDGVGGGVFGAAAIYIGARVAPSSKTIVALALSGLMLVFAGFLIFGAALTENWWAVYGDIALIVAAALTAWSIHTGEVTELDFR